MHGDSMDKETKMAYDKEVIKTQKEITALGNPMYGCREYNKDLLLRQVQVAQAGQKRLDKILNKG
jgi:hypothetical protein